MHSFKWKLEFVSNILSIIVDPELSNKKKPRYELRTLILNQAQK